MSDEFDSNPVAGYSSFWPLLILTVGLLIWFGFQDYEFYREHSAYSQQLEDKQFQTTLTDAGKITGRYVALISDLHQTAQKDSAAAEIEKAAIQAGLYHYQANSNAATPADASSTPSK